VSGARPATPKPGDLISGRYRLEEQLGEGASALVFRATDIALGRDVAVKVLRDALAASAEATARFRAEGRAAAIIAHPNVAAVFDVTPEGEAPAIVMEFVDGEDLASMLRRVGPLVPRRAAAIAAQVARGLAAAHARGIVHRDVSSRNILISREGRAQIADFGIARALHDVVASGASGPAGAKSDPSKDASPASLNKSGPARAAEGTPEYIAPEVIAGRPATAASDLYGLGVVLFELLTGSRPATPGEAPSRIRPDTPPELDRLAASLLAVKPAQRPASATAAADALEGFVIAANRTSIPARAVGPAAGAPRALAGTRVSRIAGQVGAGEPESVLAEHESLGGGEGGSPGGGEGGDPLSTRGLALTIGAVVLVALLLVGGLIVTLRLIGAGAGPDHNVKVPPLATLSLSEAMPIAESLGLQVKVIERVYSSAQPVDTILSQSPEAGTLVPLGSAIEVRVVAGTGFAIVPDVRGSPQETAIARLLDTGLRIGSLTTEVSAIVPAGSVLHQNPRSGVQVAKGTAVDLVISLGPDPSAAPSDSASPSGSSVQMPDLHCATVSDATTQLAALNLTLDAASSALSGGLFVVSTTPSAGQTLDGGTLVVLTTSATKPTDCP